VATLYGDRLRVIDNVCYRWAGRSFERDDGDSITRQLVRAVIDEASALPGTLTEEFGAGAVPGSVTEGATFLAQCDVEAVLSILKADLQAH
jgi:hypothetical protein